MIQHGTVQYCTTLPSTDTSTERTIRILSACVRIYTGTARNRTALHGLLRAVEAEERKIVNSDVQRSRVASHSQLEGQQTEEGHRDAEGGEVETPKGCPHGDGVWGARKF